MSIDGLSRSIWARPTSRFRSARRPTIPGDIKSTIARPTTSRMIQRFKWQLPVQNQRIVSMRCSPAAEGLSPKVSNSLWKILAGVLTIRPSKCQDPSWPATSRPIVSTKLKTGLGACLLALLASVSGPALAEGDPAAGEELAYTCLGCHGIDGYRNAYPSYRVPQLGGQRADYIELALKAYRSGARPHPTMRAQGGSLSDQDIADIAAWFQGEAPVEVTVSGDEPGYPEAGATCLACHGAGGAASTADTACALRPASRLSGARTEAVSRRQPRRQRHERVRRFLKRRRHRSACRFL